MTRIINYEIKSEYKGLRISAYLRKMGYPERVLTLLRKKEGNLKINGISVHMNYVLLQSSGSETLTVTISEEESSEKITPVNIPIDVIYEDEDILVINKPAFMPTHPSLNNYENTLANATANYFEEKKEPFIFRCINRLDRDTTGLTVLAKHYLAAGILAQDMQDRLIKREYTALVEGEFEQKEGTVDLPIGREDNSLITRTIDLENGERAVTNYQVQKYNPDSNLSLIRLRLETGRTHQIRVHMKAIGHPLAGDFLYNPQNRQINRQALHAGKLSFTHPVTRESMTFEIPLPEDMKALI